MFLDSLFFSPAEEEDEEEEGDDLALDQSCLLLHYILQCLTKCFIYDKTGFLTKERFETILRPLVDQVRKGIVLEKGLGDMGVS